uniref:Uncharacterized protein n=1 Tax=Ananas comosus var. bracteatus TaxID=296719 RepID=A0A6V7QEG3_ANACO|nr:unnamed protein product [Ananas comosus var. bracteatus]
MAAINIRPPRVADPDLDAPPPPLLHRPRRQRARLCRIHPGLLPRGGSGGAVAAIREGFARALVSYFPVAGRIVESVPGEPMVECSGDGIWFVEAGLGLGFDPILGSRAMAAF